MRDLGDPVEPRVLDNHGPLLRQLECGPSLDGLVVMVAGGQARGEGIRLWAPSPRFTEADGGLQLHREDPTGSLAARVEELCEWREADLNSQREVAEPTGVWRSAPEMWREYLREDILTFLGSAFSLGNWNSGIVRLESVLLLLKTLKKGTMTAGGHYDDGFLSPERMQWQSQTQTRRDSRIARMLNGSEPGSRVHLLGRNSKLRGGAQAAPILY